MPDQTFGSIKLAELLLLGSAQIFDILILASENITTLFIPKDPAPNLNINPKIMKYFEGGLR